MDDRINPSDTSLPRIDEDGLRRRFAQIFTSLDPTGSPRIVPVYRPQTELPDRLGVLPAAFNPPTLAHWTLARTARDRLELDELWLELSRANVDKPIVGAPLEDRAVMLYRLARCEPRIGVALGSHPRFLEKALAVRELFPEAELWFVVGFDTLVRVFDPRYYSNFSAELDALFQQARFACANRGRSGPEAVQEFLKQPHVRPFADRIKLLSVPQGIAELSSSAVREAVTRGELPRKAVPAGVLEYIVERGLYRSHDRSKGCASSSEIGAESPCE